MHQITEKKAAKENLPAAKMKGFEVAKEMTLLEMKIPRKKQYKI